MTEILEMLPGTVEYRLKQMEENMKAVDISSKLPECPVNTYFKQKFCCYLTLLDMGGAEKAPP